jgi:hypothetical protein
MKTLFFGQAIVCVSCLANAGPTSQIIHSCLKTKSLGNAIYTDISPANFKVDDASEDKPTSTTLVYQRHTVGIWEATESKNFGLVYDLAKIPSAKIIKLGSESPAPFTAYTALWGEARFGKSIYLCITFNFPGVGESGSFQNVRGLYLIDMNKLPKFYFVAADIREIRE